MGLEFLGERKQKQLFIKKNRLGTPRKLHTVFYVNPACPLFQTGHSEIVFILSKTTPNMCKSVVVIRSLSLDENSHNPLPSGISND